MFFGEPVEELYNRDDFKSTVEGTGERLLHQRGLDHKLVLRVGDEPVCVINVILCFCFVVKGDEKHARADVRLAQNQNTLRVDCVVNRIAPDDQAEDEELFLQLHRVGKVRKLHVFINHIIKSSQKYPRERHRKDHYLPLAQIRICLFQPLLLLFIFDFDQIVLVCTNIMERGMVSLGVVKRGFRAIILAVVLQQLQGSRTFYFNFIIGVVVR